MFGSDASAHCSTECGRCLFEGGIGGLRIIIWKACCIIHTPIKPQYQLLKVSDVIDAILPYLSET